MNDPKKKKIMKKTVYLLIAGAVLSLSACKSSESAYKQAYEKAVSDNEAKAVVEGAKGRDEVRWTCQLCHECHKAAVHPSSVVLLQTIKKASSSQLEAFMSHHT